MLVDKTVLFVPFRHNPNDLSKASGMEHNYFSSLSRSFKEIDSSELVTEGYAFLEKIVVNIFQKIFKIRYPKFRFSLLIIARDKMLNALSKKKYDFVFSVNYNAFTFIRRKDLMHLEGVKIFYLVDTMFKPWFDEYPQFPWISQKLMIWQEKRALKHINYIVSTSHKNTWYLVNYYGFNEDDILTIVNPDALPIRVNDENVKITNNPGLKLLFNGRERGRKNFDFFKKIAQELADYGDISFNVIGVEPRQSDKMHNIEYLGTYNKLKESELNAYIKAYQMSDLFLHPALFDASPISVSEAAAFGVPTIALKVGGMETSVKDGISGVLMEKESTASEWASLILEFYDNKDYLNDLKKTTRDRYKKEMCWDVVDEQIKSFILSKL